MSIEYVGFGEVSGGETTCDTLLENIFNNSNTLNIVFIGGGLHGGWRKTPKKVCHCWKTL